jgi:uncharacterized protein YPO0396
MSDRCIRLTRIHAIQWFGYCDTFDIHGNLLIAGRTGAGKSVLMDLLQLVLIGDQRARYNAASDKAPVALKGSQRAVSESGRK